MVRITGCEAFKSTTAGILVPTDVLGIYRYSGTTKQGYSGAPYLVGDNSVAAMHLFGGDSGNLCVSARYIQMVIQQLVIPARLKDKLKVYGPVLATTNPKMFGDASYESILPRVRSYLSRFPFVIPEGKGKNKKRRRMVQDDWYEEDLSQTKEIRARRSRIDPQNYEFQLGEHYYTVDDASFSRLKKLARNKSIPVYLGDVRVDGRGECVFNEDDDESSFLEGSQNGDLNTWEECNHYTVIQEVLREIRTLRTDFLSCQNSKPLNSISHRHSVPREKMELRN
ncbi:hypothetical protein 2 [Hubei sobemo-like virus 37]|uniref:hypothetical protein 2 n=1 Tax=Hubei sobemo-like virus 37 TaxID=1923224 RepID=UPI00090BDD42|nr:hypothetical protein 2 [Hubei sobemo-like virus 37]APG75781.1 hypothetical protein 2 [Hubei sobemo-like virus 37]